MMMHKIFLFLSWRRSWSQSIDQPQNLREQVARHGDLRHLERHVAGVRDNFGADLDELLPKAGQRPILDRLRQRQRPHEVGQIVGQRMKLKSADVGGGALQASASATRALLSPVCD